MMKVIPVTLLVLCTAAALALAQAEAVKEAPAGDEAAQQESAAAAQQSAEEQEPAEEPKETEGVEIVKPAGDVEPPIPVEPADGTRKQKNRAVQAQLDRALPEVTFDGVALSDVLDFLRDITNANLFVNWRALEGAGIDRNATVSARMKNVKFGKALQIILDGVGGKKGKLGFEVDEGVITISTTEDLGLNYHTRAYDVRDLLQAKPAGAGGGGGGGAGADRAATLAKLITGSVAPQSWRDKGGSVGMLRELPGRLVITQAPEHHDAIANLLNQTRVLMGLTPAEEPAPVVEEPQE